MKLRPQYHFRPGPDGLRAWDIRRLIALTEELAIVQIPVSAIRELDEPYWFGDGIPPTCRDIAEHARLINEADLSFPVILSSDGRVMDGMHRAAKALLEGVASIPARQFIEDPAPDFVGVDPEDLPY